MIVGSPSFCTPTLPFRPTQFVPCSATHRRSLLILLRSFAQERRPSPYDSIPCTLYTKTPGCHPERFFNRPILNSATSSPVSPFDATLAAGLRVGFQGLYLQTLSRKMTEISRNRPSATPLESTLTRSASVNPLGATLTKTRGRGRYESQLV
jgi:hypothetical protein